MFPTRGHSYNACDRDFTSLELRKRKQDTVYTPHQWFTVLQKARKQMHVELCAQDAFLDYKKHLDSFFKKSVTVKGTKWAVTQYKIFEYSVQSKCISVSPNSSGMVKYAFPLVKTGIVPHFHNVPRAYMDVIPLKPEKLQDVSRMIDVIPLQFREYFDNILKKCAINEVTGGEENNESGSEVWDSDQE